MLSHDLDDRTEAATPRQRAEARSLGHVPRSPGLAGTLVLLGAGVGLVLGGSRLFAACRDVLWLFLSRRANPKLDAETAAAWFREAALQVGGGIAAILVLLVCGAVIANVAQFGFVWAPQVVAPQWSRVSLWIGLRRMASGVNVTAALGATSRLFLVTLIAAWSIASAWPTLGALNSSPAPALGAEIAGRLVTLEIQLALALLALSALDVAFERWRYERGLRLTQEESRLERRLAEADPSLRNRRRETARRAATPRRPAADVQALE